MSTRSSRFVLVFTLVLVPLAVAAASDGESPTGPVRESAEVRHDARSLGVGEHVRDVEVVDVDGVPVRLSELCTGDATVLVMRGVSCPVSKKYGPRLASLERRFVDAGATFAYVHVGEHMSADEVREAAADHGLSGRLLLDREGRLAARLGAQSTTEAFVLDATRTLRYRGAVDDQIGLGFTRPEVGRSFLADAVDAVLAGGVVATAATTAPGCVLDLSDVELDAEPPTYHATVSRILQERCVSCHRDGGVGPFALDDYANVEGRKGMIRYVTEKRIMPPWGAAHGVGGPWANDRSLTERELDALSAWVDAGCPEGDPADAPLPREWPDAEWQIGEPDAVFAIPEAFTVPAEGVVDYQYWYVQTDLDEDRWVEAVEILPSAIEAVHHVLVFLEEPRRPDETPQDFRNRNQSGLFGYFAAYVPGQGARVFPDGLAKRLPARAWLKFQVHYTPNGKVVEDVTRIGLRLADAPPHTELRTGGVATTRFEIPAGVDDHEISAYAKFGAESTLYAFSPHMHLRGKAFRYELEYPDGATEVILDVPAYDFNWQTMYTLAEPKVVPAGTKVHCRAWYDNSVENPANPDPTRAVRFGEQTFDEMMIGYFEWWREGT